jgi:hypothetical protein
LTAVADDDALAAVAGHGTPSTFRLTVAVA